MVRAFEPKKYYIEHSRASKKSSQAEPSFWKHPAREPNFEPSLGSTQPYWVYNKAQLSCLVYMYHVLLYSVELLCIIGMGRA